MPVITKRPAGKFPAQKLSGPGSRGLAGVEDADIPGQGLAVRDPFQAALEGRARFLTVALANLDDPQIDVTARIKGMEPDQRGRRCGRGGQVAAGGRQHREVVQGIRIAGICGEDPPQDRQRLVRVRPLVDLDRGVVIDRQLEALRVAAR